jgi:hypothetical protein
MKIAAVVIIKFKTKKLKDHSGITLHAKPKNISIPIKLKADPCKNFTFLILQKDHLTFLILYHFIIDPLNTFS